MIYPKKFAVASAATAAFLWIACSALVAILPEAMWQMTGYMLHIEISQMNWAMNWTGFCIGLVSWSVVAGIAGGVLAAIYIRL
ncbi:hypothetical protein EYC98_17715 [Halieaceae bacterium IMCC14734]|uniref:Uncharacterized protein n=1 Tax=Candidatus Litorirhabdus singularis TaxID=2518993 RepID=A0ABT3TK65_9GAMM|nr:DUF5676 family membrane protein [Candidatus Litorirhabdus singularis]MCX2982703.1 hypothetical protein [Candidatus Litorirhabdus singularis]